MITDPAHQTIAAQMRRALAAERHTQRGDEQHRHARGGASTAGPAGTHNAASTVRRHADGHVVALRPLPDYDALFGVDFTPDPTPDFTPDIAVTSEEASS